MPAQTLVAIPVEILLDICRLVSPKDAVHLCMACKSLYGLSRHRQFWIDRLRHLLNKYHAPSLCLDILSLSLDELKRTVTRPYRFQAAIVKHRLATRTPVHLKLGDHFADAVLIPGGQWLVVQTWMAASSLLQIWDIRVPVARNLALVASTELQPLQSTLFVQPSTTEAEGVALIFVNYNNHPYSNPELSAEIYSFHPSADERSRLRLVQSVKFKRGPYTTYAPMPQHAVTMGDLLVWSFSNALFLVVDWRRHEWSFLLAFVASCLGSSMGLISINNRCQNTWMTALHYSLRSIVTFGRPQMKPWPIPPLDSVSVERLEFIHQVPIPSRDTYTSCGYSRRPRFQVWGEARSTFWHDESLRTTFFFTSEARMGSVGSHSLDDVDDVTRKMRFYDSERALPTIHPSSFALRITSETVDGRKLALLTDGQIVSCSPNKGGDGHYAYYQIFRNVPRTIASFKFPLICPLSGTIGAATGAGDLILWQEK